MGNRKSPDEPSLDKAEKTLERLANGEYPRVQGFLSAFYLRKITDDGAFDGDLTNAELSRASGVGAAIRIDSWETPRPILYYHDVPSQLEMALYARAYGEIVAVLLAAFGLSMTGYSAQELDDTMPS